MLEEILGSPWEYIRYISYSQAMRPAEIGALLMAGSPIARLLRRNSFRVRGHHKPSIKGQEAKKGVLPNKAEHLIHAGDYRFPESIDGAFGLSMGQSGFIQY